MLTLLRVKNLALVEEAAVAFAPGLNVVTGETGAGKSILIGALYLLLGERADTSAVRAGEAQCVVEATFQLADPRAVDAELAAAGLEPCDHGQLILRRTVKAAGGGQAYVNWRPFRHPQLGLVEIGGWDKMNFWRNPPPALREPEVERFPGGPPAQREFEPVKLHANPARRR